MVRSADKEIMVVLMLSALFQGGNMSIILRVCSGERCNHEVIGCVTSHWENGEKWDCVLCERKRPSYYETCSWSPWGGRKKKANLPENIIEDTCYYCKNLSDKSFKPV